MKTTQGAMQEEEKGPSVNRHTMMQKRIQDHHQDDSSPPWGTSKSMAAVLDPCVHFGTRHKSKPQAYQSGAMVLEARHRCSLRENCCVQCPNSKNIYHKSPGVRLELTSSPPLFLLFFHLNSKIFGVFWLPFLYHFKARGSQGQKSFFSSLKYVEALLSRP